MGDSTGDYQEELRARFKKSLELQPINAAKPSGPKTKLPQEIHQVSMKDGSIMLDTGCKATVGGETWHK